MLTFRGWGALFAVPALSLPLAGITAADWDTEGPYSSVALTEEDANGNIYLTPPHGERSDPSIVIVADDAWETNEDGERYVDLPAAGPGTLVVMPDFPRDQLDDLVENRLAGENLAADLDTSDSTSTLASCLSQITFVAASTAWVKTLPGTCGIIGINASVQQTYSWAVAIAPNGSACGQARGYVNVGQQYSPRYVERYYGAGCGSGSLVWTHRTVPWGEVASVFQMKVRRVSGSVSAFGSFLG